MVVYLLLLFLVLIPKSGFTYNNVPITWGYILLGILSFYIFFDKSIFKNFKIRHLYFFLSSLPFQIIYLINISVLNELNYFDFIAGFVNFIIFYYTFFFIIRSIIINYGLDNFLKKLYYCLIFTSIYGLITFLYTNITGNFVEIRGINIPFGEYTPLIEKSNDKFGLYKLVSTYNNGNIFGICMLMFYPIFKFLNSSKLALITFQMSLIFTLSRTVWLGLFFIEISFLLYKRFKLSNILSIIIVVLVIVFICLYMDWGFDYIFDTNLGGRLDQFNLLSESTFFDLKSFGGIVEIIYLSIAYTFGYFGLILFFIYLLAPIIYSRLSGRKSDKLSYCLSTSLFCYLLCGFSDGAILMIPVFPIYLLVSCLLIIRTDQMLLCNNLKY